ncbi:MAG: DUF1015 domain-containing protein [Phycisphaeraceae bacterium]|nr:DUF1015 domain-containing protein [Phycisphaeraceae bacterium]
MPTVHPFAALRYNDHDLSKVVAPPYDVLSEAAKSQLLERSRQNIVAVDLPHTPPKERGPDEVYRQAGEIFRRWKTDGTLVREGEPAIYLYRQRAAKPDGRVTVRCGVCCCIDVVKLGPRPGGGVLPHEETFSGPKEDRLALMQATRAQLSPIFGLHADDQALASQLARDAMSRFAPSAEADTDDGVQHESWTITDGVIIRAYQDALRNEDVFIADGHHRYTTQLNYLSELERQHGPLPNDHPARRCMTVLIGMNDPGLEIWPTHRVLGGMADYSFDTLLSRGSAHFRHELVSGGLRALADRLEASDATPPGPIALYDYATETGAIIHPNAADPLREAFPDRCEAWRNLDVAYVQHVVVEQLCRQALNRGEPVTWTFPHTVADVDALGARHGRKTTAASSGRDAQLAVLVKPTPIQAVREVSRAGELMPQKSTFFYPKLATGLWINPLE